MKITTCISFLLFASGNLIGQWVQTSGPSGGGVSDFAFTNGKILAATFDLGNGVFASTDNGSSWHESGLQGMMLTKISAFNNTVISATTHNFYNETDEIFRSTDAGDSWKSVLTVPNINGIRSICHFQSKWYFSAQGQNGGIFVSADDGVNWTKTTPASFNFTHPVPLVSSNNSLVAGTDVQGIPAIYYSSDGSAWTHTKDSVAQAYCGTVSSDNTIWLGVTGGVIYSDNGGKSWTHPFNINLELPQDEYFTSVAASGNHLVAVSSLNNTYYSWDAGNHLTKVSGNGLPVNVSYFFSIALSDTTYFLGASTGIMRSQNKGANWQYSTNGLRAVSISALASNGSKIFAATERGVSYTADAGSTWHDPQNPADLDDLPISGFLNGVSNFYAFGSGIYSLNGSSWTTIDTNAVTAITEGVSGRLFASRESNDPIAGTGGIFISDNGGSKWDSLLTFTNTFDTEYYFLPHCLSSHGATIVAIQCAIAFQTFTRSYAVFRSSDNGVSWHSIGTPNSASFVYYADNAFYMGTLGGGLFRSDDDGVTWHPTAINSKSDVTALLKTGSWLFAAVLGNGNIADGIYMSGDNGYSWRFVNDGAANIAGQLATDGTYLFSGGPSVWKRPLNQLGVKDPKIISKNTVLELYPNPSRDLITLHINSSDPFNGIIIITDQKGSTEIKQEIHIESNGRDAAFSLAGFAEGAYYVKIVDKSGFEIGSSRFVVMRK